MAVELSKPEQLEPIATEAYRRSKPHVMIVDLNFQFVYVEPSALTLLAECLGIARDYVFKKIPPPIERAVRKLLEERPHDSDRTICPFPGLVIHVAPVFGEQTGAITLLVERQQRRDGISAAIVAHGLTRRESDVLKLLVSGHKGEQIAAELAIAPATVNDYIKAMLKKTGSKSRSELICKVLRPK